jgi:ribosome-associated protein
VIVVPRPRILVKAVVSGGPGGQNVNKVATKVEIRFRLEDADWMPPHVRARLAAAHRGNLTTEGEFFLTSSAHRTRRANEEAAFERLAEWITEAAAPIKRRKATKPTRSSDRRRLDGKKRDSAKKSERRSRDW